MPDAPTSPENYADQLDRLARILLVDASGKVEALLSDERTEYHQQLDALLSSNVTAAVIGCLRTETREYLAGYTEGVPEFSGIRSLLERAT